MSSRKAEFDFSRPLTGGPLDRGFDNYFGLRMAPSSPPCFYIRDREAVAKPTEYIARPTNVEDKRMSWQAGACAPGFVHAEILPNMLKETLKLIHDHANQDKGKPLFIYLALAAPHTPLVPSARFAGKSKIGACGDFVMEIDDLVGQVNAAFQEARMDRNTLLIFSSDNGALLVKGEQERTGHSVNGVLRGGKAHPYEGGHRVPFLAKDLSETTDVSEKNSECLEQLVRSYEEFRATWTLRPEAVIHRERKQNASRRKPQRTKDRRPSHAEEACASPYQPLQGPHNVLTLLDR